MTQKPSYEELGKKIKSLEKEAVARKKVEKSLRESEEKYRLLVKNLPSIVYRGYKDWSVEFFDNKFELLTGFNINDFNNKRKTLLDIILKEDIELTREYFIRALKTDKSYVREFRLRSKDGKILWIQERGQIVCDTNGEIQYISGVFFDITERKHAEQVLRESEERLKAVFEANPDPVVVYNTDGHPQYLNPAFSLVFGWTINDLRGKRIPFVPEDQKELTFSRIKALYESGEPERFETKRLAKDGQILDIFISAASIKDSEGHPFGMVVNLTDITQRKKMEAQFQAAQRMEAIGTLAGGIAHDFNNLLMGIQGNISIMLLNKNPGDTDYSNLKNIEQHVRKGADLARQLLGFAKGGKYEVKLLNLNELIKKESRMFGRTKKEIAIQGKYQKDIWTVMADQSQIEQVILNLYVNAWQAMDGGGNLYTGTQNVVLDKAYVEPYQVKPGKFVKFSVSDTGIGMDEKTQLKIFDPFFTTKKMGRGTGLGLSSVYGIVKNHGGFINVYSRKGEGATFNIYLPVVEGKGVVPSMEENDGPAISHGTETVLMIDDEEMITDVGGQMLESLGYRVITAGSGKEALDIFRQNHENIDMIILDMIMPRMGGGETYDAIKKIKPDVKVLLSSGYSLNGQAQEILDRGCNGFIQKPFRINNLSDKIRAVLNPDVK